MPGTNLAPTLIRAAGGPEPDGPPRHLRPGHARSRRHRRWSDFIATAAGLAFAAFISLFSLDGPLFSAAFFMQNILTALVVLATALGWCRASLGAAAILALAVAGAWQFNTLARVDMFALFTLPPLLIAGLFALNWRR